MNSKQKKLLAVLLAALHLMLNIPMLSAAASTNIYYVSPNGSNDWEGTLEKPFLTLEHAASVMQAGDTCYVRGGIYRETLQTQLKGTEAMPISFKAYENESVTISGADELSNWSQYEGNIYVTDMNWDIYNGDGNIVFADGELCTEGRWPNSTDLLSTDTYARIDSKEGLTIYDADLPSYDLTGANVWIASGVGFWSYLSKVTEQDTVNHKITIEDVFHSADYRPIKGNIYYISGSLSLLDSANEWYKDTQNGKLYFYASDGVNPNDVSIEVRKREYAINLSDSSYVTFDGINVRGALVNFGDNTYNCTFTNATVETVDYDMPTHQMTYASYQPSALGIMIGGSFNTVSKCEIKNMYGEGITLSGNNNRIINNYIHDINFEHTYSDGIYITGKNHLISHNTIEKTGRGAIGGTFDSCVISYNDVSDASRLSRDAGVLYFNAHNYQNSEIHHNIIHSSLNNEDIQCGLYFDSFTSSMIVYNNLIYGHEFETNENDRNDDRYSLLINPNSLCNLFINNTVINYTEKVGGLQMTNGNGDRSGSVFLNNLFYSMPFEDSWNQGQNIIYKNNLAGSSFWTDVYNSDLTLCEASKAIDSAIYVPGINDSYIGNAPDCGALEYGAEPWSAGHNFSVEYDDKFALNEQIPFKNLVKNSGFENKIGNEWEVNGTPERFYVSSWSFWGALSKDGYYSLKLNNNDKIEQKFTGLKPNTTYELGLYGRVSGNVILAHKFTDCKDNLLNTATVPVKGISDGMWIKYDNVDFGNGRIFDKICIGVKNPDATGTVEVYIDELESTAVSTLNFTGTPDLSGWVWSEGELSTEAEGLHSVYIKFNGSFSNSGFGAFYLDSESLEDSIVCRAVSDSGETNAFVTNSRAFDKTRQYVTVKTGELGTIDLSIYKSEGELYGYVDCISLQEAYPENDEISSVNAVLKNYSVTDENGTVLFGIDKGGEHKISGTVKNMSLDANDILIKLEAFNGSDELINSKETSVSLNGGEEKGFDFTSTAALSEGAYFKLIFDDGKQTVSYMISDLLLEKQYNGDSKLIFKDASVRNINGELISEAVCGQFNLFELEIKNSGTEKIPMRGILAIYNAEEKLVDILLLERNIIADSNDRFLLGTVIAEDEGTHAKLFVWEKTEKLTPILKSYKFD